MQLGMSLTTNIIVSIWDIALFLIFLLVMVPRTEHKSHNFYNTYLSSNLRAFATSEVIGLVCALIWFIVEPFNLTQILFALVLQTVFAMGLSYAGGTFRKNQPVTRNVQRMNSSQEE